MELGKFSISLTVKDIAASRAFYEKLGFKATGGNESSWLILVNGGTVIGLFQGMFERNMLTFTPGLDIDGFTDEFTDVRVLRQAAVDAGLELVQDTTQDTPEGPASVILVDPDGNPILIDQHR
jgi:lactoylglutathione lyase